MNPDFDRAIRSMTSPGDHVICALSGGRDSMVLLHLLLSMRRELKITVSAAHYNHNLRGEESDRDEQFVRDFCRANDIPLETGSGDVAAFSAEHHMGVEAAARTLRYAFLLGLSPAAKIATAHNADDNLETLLMHLLRGSGLRGLTGIAPVRDRIIRPLLGVSRAEIDACAREFHIPYVEDSSNAQDDCLRNRLRHHVVPLLLEENPNLPITAFSMAQTFRMDDDFLLDAARRSLGSVCRQGALNCDAFLALPIALQYRCMALFLEQVPEIGRVHLDAAIGLCRSASPSAMLDLPGAYTLSRVYGDLVLGHPADTDMPCAVPIAPGERVVFGPYLIACRRGVLPKVLPENTVALLASALHGQMVVRARLPGDRITLSGGTKKLSRFLMDQKVPASLRDTLPVLTVGDTVAAILPLRAAAFCTPEAGSDSLLLTVNRLED